MFQIPYTHDSFEWYKSSSCHAKNNSRRIYIFFFWTYKSVFRGLKKYISVRRQLALCEGSLPREVETFSSFLSETRLCPSGCTSVNVCRLPAGVVSPNFAREIIHFGTRFQGVKKGERREGEGRRRGQDLVERSGTADINNATCVSGSLEPGCFRAQHPPLPFSSYLNAFYYVHREREGERRFHEITREKRGEPRGNNATSHLKI